MAVRQRAVATLPNLIRSLRKECPKPMSQAALPSLRRAFSLYDQVNLIDNVPEDQLRFQRYTETGFTVNGVDYEGSLLCVGNLLMSWAPKKFTEITPDSWNDIFTSLIISTGQVPYDLPDFVYNIHSLSIFRTVRPIPEILILGCGRYIEPVGPELRRFVRSTGMKLEVLDSRNATSTYNILNEEGRIVAAALLPYGISS